MGERKAGRQAGRQTNRNRLYFTLKFRGLPRVSNCFIQVQCKLFKEIYPRGGWVSVSSPLERAHHPEAELPDPSTQPVYDL